MSGVGLHIDVALNLLNAGAVFNVTMMEGNPVMLESTRDGHAVTESVRDFVVASKGSFSEEIVAFCESDESVLDRARMVELAALALEKGWDALIGAAPLHGTLTIGARNPLRCSFFLFGHGGGAGHNDDAAEAVPVYSSGFSGRLGCAMRILPTGPTQLALLNLSQHARSVADVKSGLVLAVGAPGAGKSTTAGAYIEHVNCTRSGSIVTAEAPIEVPFTSKKSIVSQREVGINVASVALALRDAERNFAHSALVGEIQTPQDELDAFMAARHGMFVVATSFANSATDAVKTLASALDRESMDGADLAASTLLAVIYQVRLPSTHNGRWEFAYECLVVHDNEPVQNFIRQRDWRGLQAHVSADTEISLNGALTRLVRQQKIHREYALMQAYDKKGAAPLIGAGA